VLFFPNPSILIPHCSCFLAISQFAIIGRLLSRAMSLNFVHHMNVLSIPSPFHSDFPFPLVSVLNRVKPSRQIVSILFVGVALSVPLPSFFWRNPSPHRFAFHQFFFSLLDRLRHHPPIFFSIPLMKGLSKTALLKLEIGQQSFFLLLSPAPQTSTGGLDTDPAAPLVAIHWVSDFLSLPFFSLLHLRLFFLSRFSLERRFVP